MNSNNDSQLFNHPHILSLIQAIEHHHFPHAWLFVGEDFENIRKVTHHLAGLILPSPVPESCLDFYEIFPSGAMQQIAADTIRTLCDQIMLSPKSGQQKCVILYDVERLHRTAANAFLKTLEEPPSDTYIFLTTSHLHQVLPTISGRCSICRLPFTPYKPPASEIRTWGLQYEAWLGTVYLGSVDNTTTAIMGLYKLLTELEQIINHLIASFEDSAQKKTLYRSILCEIGHLSSHFFRENPSFLSYFYTITHGLHQSAQIIELNGNILTAIENLFLTILASRPAI